MTPFGFTPGNSDDSNEPVDFAAMMQQMHQSEQMMFPMLSKHFQLPSYGSMMRHFSHNLPTLEIQL